MCFHAAPDDVVYVCSTTAPFSSCVKWFSLKLDRSETMPSEDSANCGASDDATCSSAPLNIYTRWGEENMYIKNIKKVKKMFSFFRLMLQNSYGDT